MYNSWKRRSQDFKRRILSRIYTSRKETFIKEFEWLRLIKGEELGRRYYNFCINPPLRRGSKLSKISCERMSASRKGVPAWNKGKKNVYSEETKQKMSESHKGKMTGFKHSEASKAKIKEKRKMQVISDEHKMKISKKMINIKKSDEHRENIRKSKMGENNPMSKKNIELRNRLHKEGL